VQGDKKDGTVFILIEIRRDGESREGHGQARREGGMKVFL
jgi:hypothetical protein